MGGNNSRASGGGGGRHIQTFYVHSVNSDEIQRILMSYRNRVHDALSLFSEARSYFTQWNLDLSDAMITLRGEYNTYRIIAGSGKNHFIVEEDGDEVHGYWENMGFRMRFRRAFNSFLSFFSSNRQVLPIEYYK